MTNDETERQFSILLSEIKLINEETSEAIKRIEASAYE